MILKKKNIDTEEKELNHLVKHREKEGRKYNNFIKNTENNINKKNIAILFSGQIRSNLLSLNKNNNNLIIDSIIDSIDINFINNEFKNKYNYDIFISTDELDLEKTLKYFGNNIKNIYLSDRDIYLDKINNHIVPDKSAVFKILLFGFTF